VAATPEILACLVSLLRDDRRIYQNAWAGAWSTAAHVVMRMGSASMMPEILARLAYMLDEAEEALDGSDIAFDLGRAHGLDLATDAGRVVEHIGSRAATPRILARLTCLLGAESASLRMMAGESCGCRG